MTDRKTIAVKRTVRAVIFVIVLAALLHGIYYLVRPASAVRMSRTRSYESARVFDEKPDSLDVIFLGHSGVYSSVSPMELYKEYGFTSYVCAQPLQLPWESSRWLESLVRVQSPRLVVFEVDHLFYDKNSTVAANSVPCQLEKMVFAREKARAQLCQRLLLQYDCQSLQRRKEADAYGQGLQDRQKAHGCAGAGLRAV